VAAAANDRDLVITRVLRAPRKLVWAAWTESEHMARWHGPRGFGARVEANDFRPGGHWAIVMIGPDGTEYPSKGVYREIVPLVRIVTTDEFGDEFKATTTVDLPDGMVCTTVFEDAGPHTKLTITITHPTAEDRAKHEAMGVVAGWGSSLDCLADHLAGQQGGDGQSIGEVMGSAIFVNVPVADLPKSVAFFKALGFTFNAQFTNEKAAALVVNEHIYAMLLTTPFFQSFIPGKICEPTHHEAILCLSCDSRTRVSELVAKAVAAGGTSYNEPKDHGFMFQHGFRDPDGHIWELFYMDPDFVKKG
jgi:predicted lactoylglutathione lyase/uncharacterized protein YndB with AHSA1/START domain